MKKYSPGKGGLICGPSMFVVRDRPGARIDPAVIAPLDKLKAVLSENEKPKP